MPAVDTLQMFVDGQTPQGGVTLIVAALKASADTRANETRAAEGAFIDRAATTSIDTLFSACRVRLGDSTEAGFGCGV